MWIIVLLALWFVFFVIFAHKESKEVYGYNDLFLTPNASPWTNLSPSRAKIEDVVMSMAKKHHISPELLLKIAKCESGLRVDAQNPHSSASGIFQFLTSTFINQAQAYGLPLDKNSPDIQIELAARMIKDGKIGHWNASKTCWQR